MLTKPNIEQHNRQAHFTASTPEVDERVRRGESSQYADWIRDMKFRSITRVVVVQNTPSYYNSKGWEKVEPLEDPPIRTLQILDGGVPDKEVWIKTATLGGRAKVYVRPIGKAQ